MELPDAGKIGTRLLTRRCHRLAWHSTLTNAHYFPLAARHSGLFLYYSATGIDLARNNLSTNTDGLALVRHLQCPREKHDTLRHRASQYQRAEIERNYLNRLLKEF